MELCTGKIPKRIWQIKDLQEVMEEVSQSESSETYPFDGVIAGSVFVIRNYKEFVFIIIRTGNGNIQTVADLTLLSSLANPLTENACVEIRGRIRQEARAPWGFEILVNEMKVLSTSSESVKIVINKKHLNMSIENDLNNRPITLRHPVSRAIFKIQEGICRGFRDYLLSQQFTEIHSPKIVAAGAEGGSNIFKLDYFDRKAFLAQSPQFYKQTMVGVYDRVFEVGPVFRAEKHNTTRHLNEYTSLDFEMGYIEGFEDVMNMETAMLQYTFRLLESDYSEEIRLLRIEIPSIDTIPCVRFDEGKELISRVYKRPVKDPYDLQPEEEHLIGEYFKKEYNSDFVFVTHYPSKKRPFYAMDDPENSKFTVSFDLLFRGMEVTTGGQRIHDYTMQKEKMLSLGMDPDEFESYLMIHRYGMPPHGGLGIGLERLTMKLTDQNNIRFATLFPRDRTRLVP